MSWTILERLIAVSVDLAVLAALTWGGIRLLRPRSPRLVALLWLVVMVRPLVGLAVGPLVPLALPRISLAEPAEMVHTEREEVVTRSGREASEKVVLSGKPALVAPLAPISAGLWVAGLAALALAAARDRLRLARLLRTAEPAPEPLRERMAEVARRLGVPEGRALPCLRVTRELESPALAGVWSPSVLVPAWLAAAGTGEQLRWAFAHELTHWRMGDTLAAAVRQVFQTVFFFHPAAWWVGRQWEEAAELACDRALVSTPEEAASYAERLYEMLAQAQGHRRAALAGGLFATRTQIGRRIAALLSGPVGPVRLRARSAAGLALLALLSLAVGSACSHRNGNLKADLELTGPEGKLSLGAEGRFALAPNHDDVEALAPGSRLVLEQERSGGAIRIEISAGADGEVRRAFTVDGKARPYDREGRAWMARTLPRFASLLEPRGEIRFARPITRTWRRLESRARRLLP
jgi:beta-lactamase regulating signal transducer with metallopeptidase domain